MEGVRAVAPRDLTAQEAAAVLERRGGQVDVRTRVRASGSFSPTDKTATYRCRGRKDGATVIEGPGEKRWLLRTDADRASLAADMARVKDSLDAHSAGPGLVVVLNHRDELQSDGGYGQVGCLLALVSTAVGLAVGLATAWFMTGGISGGFASSGRSPASWSPCTRPMRSAAG